MRPPPLIRFLSLERGSARWYLLDRHDHNSAAVGDELSVIRREGTATRGVAASVDPEEDGLLGLARLRLGPDVERQAVLAHGTGSTGVTPEHLIHEVCRIGHSDGRGLLVGEGRRESLHAGETLTRSVRTVSFFFL